MVLDIWAVFCRSDSDLDVGLDVWTVFYRSDGDLGVSLDQEDKNFQMCLDL